MTPDHLAEMMLIETSRLQREAMARIHTRAQGRLTQDELNRLLNEAYKETHQ